MIGESGAGKTETVKILMDHIAHISLKHKNDKIVNKVLESNPLLESFGNAKTIRNDNSSRFGKFIELQFDNYSKLVGSKCVTYLLEKTRVIQQAPNERCFHVMYQLLAAPETIKHQLKLSGKDRNSFNYTNSSDLLTTIIEGISDEERYHKTVKQLSHLGVYGLLNQLLEKSLTSILYLGQISLIETNDDHDISQLSTTDTESSIAVDIVCEFLGLERTLFIQNITTRLLGVDGSIISVPLTKLQAISTRDALAKEIYSRIFQWLVNVINYNTIYDSHMNLNNSNNNSNVNSTDKATENSIDQSSNKRVIGLLDIFGFESFNINRFEQLCINYTNEKLQQKFIEDVFKTVQIEYVNEGLNLDTISYQDNSNILELIDGKLGIYLCLFIVIIMCFYVQI